MITLTCSLRHWLWKNHRDLISPLMFGHLEVFTPEIKEEYLKWVQTEEGKSYLKGGSNYQE